MFIFWLGLKLRLQNQGSERNESERGVFNWVQVAITASPFSIQAVDLDNGEQHGSLCVAPPILFPL